MRLILFFDLPMVSQKEKKIYSDFRKYLIKNGYIMIQFSVYCKIFNNRDAERLVLAKPCSKEEFIKVPGFKEKRYQVFGKEIINIFKNNQ